MLTTATETPLSDPAVSPPPGPPLSATATDSVLALLPTPELPLPTLPGLPRVSTVLSDTTTVRGAPMPMPTTATATDTVLES